MLMVSFLALFIAFRKTLPLRIMAHLTFFRERNHIELQFPKCSLTGLELASSLYDCLQRTIIDKIIFSNLNNTED